MGMLLKEDCANSKDEHQMTRMPVQSVAARENWAKDFDLLFDKLSNQHPDLYHACDRTVFAEEFAALKAQIPYCNDSEILVSLMRLVASVEDSHTRITKAVTRINPLVFYWFDEGIYVTGTTHEYEELLHGRLEGVGGVRMAEVIERLRPLIPCDNESQLKEELPKLLNQPEILAGVKLFLSKKEASYQIRTTAGIDTQVTLQSICRNTARFYREERLQSCISSNPISSFYWWEYMPAHKTLYLRYDICEEDGTFPHNRLIQELLGKLHQEAIDNLVIDLRYNQGGNTFLLQPFLDELPMLKSMKWFETLYVLIGRATFSSGLMHALNLKRRAGAVLLGQSTAGKPNHYGEIREFRLPYSGLYVSCSTRYFRLSKEELPTLVPDLQFPFTFLDYLAHRDRVLEHILFRASETF